ncbi:hypothetical protein J2S77_002060 [Alkalibacillus salilacus]|uniref:Potassium ABC transporter ATPase n=1 Tax=Alkalibacillus salilacus TaxID=284582 RepID=A0ABT9VGG2_9BACI|nr:hypothetical protein [Alkalibacillus salilacus]NIK13254.1 hypothetical protein [Alkalibacillus almallahensis]
MEAIDVTMGILSIGVLVYFIGSCIFDNVKH